MLCSSESLALAALDAFKGSYVVLVGELFPHTLQSNPWCGCATAALPPRRS